MSLTMPEALFFLAVAVLCFVWLRLCYSVTAPLKNSLREEFQRDPDLFRVLWRNAKTRRRRRLLRKLAPQGFMEDE